MRREVLAPLGLMTVGEAPGVSADEAPLFVDPARGELDMIFHFDHAGIDRAPEDFWTPSPWRLSDLKDVLARWDEALDGRGWGSLYLGNHDLPRMVSRFGDRGEYRVQSAKLLATLLLTLRGTPYIYQGDEIGMANCPFAAIDDYRDIAARNKWLEGRAQGRDPAALLADLALVGRDHARTPMQWDGSAHAGFSRAEPWIGVNPDHDVVNVAAQRSDPGSVLSHYRRLIALRKATPALRKGDFEVIASAEAVFAYRRRLVDDQVVVVLNFSPLPQPLPELSPSAEWALGNYPASAGGLRPWEARVLRLVPVRAYASPACSMHEVDPDYMGLPDEPPRGG
jgi:oligo-1,6-glucosidase